MEVLPIEDQLERVEGRVGRVEGRLRQVEIRIERVEERLERVESHIVSLATKFGEHVVNVERRFDRLEELIREKL
ncbi:hypothetical protein [Candidatus Palauibacter sp.]|uniref:hypothetical protein n=1 Tax=Candidatus Palauibacter sp. TaxID=3101350 RepID=UPI003B52E13B